MRVKPRSGFQKAQFWNEKILKSKSFHLGISNVALINAAKNIDPYLKNIQAAIKKAVLISRFEEPNRRVVD